MRPVTIERDTKLYKDFKQSQKYSILNLTSSERKCLSLAAIEGNSFSWRMLDSISIPKSIKSSLISKLLNLKSINGTKILSWAVIFGLINPKEKLLCSRCNKLRYRFISAMCSSCAACAQTEKILAIEDRRPLIEKAKATLSKKYGKTVTNVMHVKKHREKQTQRIRETHQERGEEILAKRQKTLMSKYGVTHQIHSQQIRRKIFQLKSIKISGKVYKYQGYENYVLQFLLAKGYIVSTKVKGVIYRSKGKLRHYYPDIKAKLGSRKIVVEVKSTYTFNWTKSNQPKKLFAASQHYMSKGLNFYIFIVYPNKNIAKIIKNPTELAHLTLKGAKVVTL